MLDLAAEISRRRAEYLTLYSRYVNPRLAKVLQFIEFARPYVRAQGPYLYDEDGNEYLDMLAGYGVFAVGRNHPSVKEVLRRYLDLDYPSMVQLDAPVLAGITAEKLLALAPRGLENVFFTNSGTEGVETALKFAKGATGRTKILYGEKDFHGLTLGSLSVNGSKEFREGFEPLLPGTTAIPYGDLQTLEAHLARKDVAALILEPIQGKTVRVPPEGYLAEAGRHLDHGQSHGTSVYPIHVRLLSWQDLPRSGQKVTGRGIDTSPVTPLQAKPGIAR